MFKQRSQMLRCAAGLAGMLLLAPSALGQDLESTGRSIAEIQNAAQRLASQRLSQDARLRSRTFVEERLADGQLFFNLRDYVRASIIFTDIVDNYPTHAAYSDALYMLADSLFRAGDYLGARTHFRQYVERGNEDAFRSRSQQALGRLIEVAIHIRDFDGVEEYFARLQASPDPLVQGSADYFRGKFLYSRAVPSDDAIRSGSGQTVSQPGLDDARGVFGRVASQSAYFLQSLYFMGTIDVLQGKLPQAVDSFQRVLSAPQTTEEQRQVSELARLALGRVFYELDRTEQAIESYQAVSRVSEYFDSALLEIAWVYIRAGDSIKAERALEVLTVAVPESRFIPDAKVLRGNLLLRGGRFEEADRVFEEVREQFGPVERQIEETFTGHGDIAAHFSRLLSDNLEAFDANALLPAEAVQWVQWEGGEMQRALGLLTDLGQSARLVRESDELVARLEAVLAAANAVSAFADTRQQKEQSLALRNRLTGIRKALISQESNSDSGGSTELIEIRERRRALESELAGLPTRGADFDGRIESVTAQYRAAEGDARAAEVEVMGLQARVVALEQFLKDSEAREGSQSNLDAVRTELVQQKEAVRLYFAQIAELRRAAEVGRATVGLGDERFTRDAQVRREYREAVDRERQLMAGLGLRGNVMNDALFNNIATVELTLDQVDGQIDAAVTERTSDIRRQLDEEKAKLALYRGQLGAVQGDSTSTISTVAVGAFQGVRNRFHDLVMRSDVGRIDVAWADREEHVTRIEIIQRERTGELRALDDEYREIEDRPLTEEGAQ